MATVLIATESGCRAFPDAGDEWVELAGRQVSVLVAEANGGCLAVVGEPGVVAGEIWRRNWSGRWTPVGNAGIPVQSLGSVGGWIYAGGLKEAAIVRLAPSGETERLAGLDRTPGCEEWFAGGPPLGVRSLAATADGATLLAAVHVGGVPRSADGGVNWTPTMPIMFDVHEISAHAAWSNLVVAAAAVGLCGSEDGGQTWRIVSDGLDEKNALAVAMLGEEALFSVQEGPFASRSQIYRWRIGSDRVEQVTDGLPEWLDGKVDTAHIAAGCGKFAVVDGGGSLWVSKTGPRGWERVCSGLGYVFGVAIV